ncbi:MAG: peptidase [Gammaproteobacteria bacterium]|nr:MAG: peptidase [Gammaproteobacteria bacterium]
MKTAHPILKFFSWCFLSGASGALIIFCSALLYLSPKLPSFEKILDIQLQIPLRVYTAEQQLIAEFGEKKRTPITFDQIPDKFVHAILAAEDSRFYSHHGVDVKGLTRAFIELATTGSIQTGGSTITMQVAKNYFLSREKTFLRKFNEILLALEMERELDKNKILELYVNKIYLGHRAYGIEAAANTYYGKSINDLTVAQLAMIAGLPKAPSAFNPITNPSRSQVRRDWILSRMLDLGYLSESEYQEAIKLPITAELKGAKSEVEAAYLAEMVRKHMYRQYGKAAYTKGFNVFTTLQKPLQSSANKAVIDGLVAYDQRHGFRGPEAHIELPEPEATIQTLAEANNNEPATAPLTDFQKSLMVHLRSYRTIAGLIPGIVVNTSKDTASVLLKTRSLITIPLANSLWARTYYNVNERGAQPSSMADILKRGDIIRARQRPDQSWEMVQIPTAQSALVSLNPNNGAVLALVGGFDFQSSKFNRVLQGGRQAGSSFKPFIYSAALENGFTAATVINDAPVVFKDKSLESTWRPENSSGKFFGPTRLRQALYKSRNLVSIRVLREIGPYKAIKFAERMGFSKSDLPNNLSLALGSAAVKPWDLAAGYAVFANGGYKIEPWFIERIEDNEGKAIFEATPLTVCKMCETLNETADASAAEQTAQDMVDSNLLDEPQSLELLLEEKLAQPGQTETPAIQLPAAQRVVDERIVYVTTSMLQDVIKRGTGTKARTLKRNDIAGKTGTTNDQKDAWFSGYNKDVVTTVWVGFDKPETLGRREYGGTVALPIWIDYMRTALADKPDERYPQPEGIVTVKIDPSTGKRAVAGQANAIFEIFREEYAPKTEKRESVSHPDQDSTGSFEELF